jgi:hypothetical protein
MKNRGMLWDFISVTVGILKAMRNWNDYLQSQEKQKDNN